MKIVRAKETRFVPASHENPAAPGVLKKVLLTGDTLAEGRIQMINWALLPPRSAFARHYHEDMEEVFIIVRGQARITVDEDEARLGPGDAVVIQQRGVHQMENIGAEDVEYVVVGISRGIGGKTIVVENA